MVIEFFSDSICFTSFWEDSPEVLTKKMMKAITDNLECRPVYWGIHTNTPICNSKEKMAAFERYFFNHYFGSNESVCDIPPCIEIESMNIEYSDIEAEDQNKIEENNAERYHSQEPLDWFKVRLWFRSNQFMEIKQVRAYNFQDLVGNAGGYIGLFLGYSLVQSPFIIKKVYDCVQRILMSTYFWW